MINLLFNMENLLFKTINFFEFNLKMKLIENLQDLEVGDFIKIHQKAVDCDYFRIGEITHKWQEAENPGFELKIITSSLPYSTEEMISKVKNRMKGISDSPIYKKPDLSEEEIVLRLDEEEKTTLIKKIILKKL